MGDSGTYHKDVYMPEWIRKAVPISFKEIKYTNHAKQQAYKRGINLPSCFSDADLISAEIRKGDIVSALYRVKYKKHQDLCIVMSFVHEGYCVSCWINRRNDKHDSLDKNRYRRY